MKRKISPAWISLVLASTIMISLLISAAAPNPMSGKGGPQQSVYLWLTLLHNNDGESDLVNLGTGREDYGGVARFKSLVDLLKRKALKSNPFMNPDAKRGVLMVSSGDNFLAGPEFNASLEKGVPFYDTIAMDMIGYDAVAIGNHDFDFGPDILADFIAGYQITQPTYLASNLDFSGEPRLQDLYDQGRIANSTIAMVDGVQVGIIGAVTPRLRYISSPRNVGVMDDVAAAIQGEVDALEAQGVVIIILISHLQSIEEDLALAPLLDGVDIMVAGGGDEILANPRDRLIPGDETNIYGPYPMWASDMDGTAIPVVTTAGSYAYVGRLVAGFDQNGEVKMVEGTSGPVRVAGTKELGSVRPDPVMQAMVVDPVEAALETLASNVIGFSEVDLDGRRSPGVRTMETNEGNLVADSMFWQASLLADSFGVPAPDVALQNGGGIRNNNVIPAGDITELETFNILPFANFVSIIEGISREQFKEILENAVSRVEFSDGRFAQIAGFSFVWDPSGTPQVLDIIDGSVTTAGTRIRDVVLDDGTVIVEDGEVQAGPDLTVASIDFLARGGDQYPFRDAPFTTLGVTYQQALSNYIQDGLGGLISAADYPVGGEGRITTVAIP